MIRSVTPADFPQLLDLQVACISDLTDTYNSQEREAWIHYIQQEGAGRYASYSTYVSVSSREIIGFVSWSTNTSGHTAAIECLYVAKSHQKKQQGRQLLRKAESTLPTNTLITVRSTLNARPFYESSGYKHTEDISSRAGFLASVMEKHS